MVVVEFDDEWASGAEWARMYRELGWQVMPAHLPSDGGQWKRPLLDWAEFQDSLTPDALFERWYGAGGEYAARKNMGLVTGLASGRLFCVDLDLKLGSKAFSWWNGLLAVHANSMAPETPTQKTGGGGDQVLFKAPEGWSPPTFKTPIGIDVRGQGGWMMCPPSLHESGQTYDWYPGREPWAVDLLEAPAWLIEAIEELREDHGGQPTGPREHTASEGAKNAFGLDVDDREHKLQVAVWGAVVDLYRLSPVPPDQLLQRSEIERIWSNYECTTKSRLMQLGRANADLLELEGRGLSELIRKWNAAMRRWDTKVKAAAGEARPAGAFTADPGPAETPASATGLFAVPDPDESPPVVRASNLTGEAAPQGWVVHEWIVQGAVNSLYGDGGLGKTLLAQQLAYAVSLGERWLGMATTKGLVLAVFCEDAQAELHRRHVAIKAAMGHAIGNPFRDVWLWPRIGGENTLIAYDRAGVPVLQPFHAELLGMVESLNPTLLILDTLADVFAGNELDRPQVNYFAKRVLGGLIRHQKQRGHELTILLLGHPSVSGMSQGGRGYSGSTAWNNAVRSRIYLTRPEKEDGDARLLTRGKANYASSGDETAIRLVFADGVLRAERTVETGSTLGLDIEAEIAKAVRRAWEAGAPYSLQKGHRRNCYGLIPRELNRLGGYEPLVVRAVLRDMLDDGRLAAVKKSGRSGLGVVE